MAKKTIDLLGGSIFGSLSKLAVPIMATAFVQTAYNLTDMAWIGLLGSKAVAAIGAAGMLTWFSQGICMIAKMGGQVETAQSIGRADEERAGRYASAALQITVIAAILFAIVTNLFAGPIIAFFHLSDAWTVQQAIVYLRITCGLIVFSFLSMTLTGLFTAIGDSRTPFLANCIGLGVNMIFDPVLILGIGPAPRFGVAGAAMATVFAQAIVFLVLAIGIAKTAGRGESIWQHISVIKHYRGTVYRNIIRVGTPSGIQNMIYTFISMVLTRVIAGWGDGAVAVLRVGGQIESISWSTAEAFGAAINAFEAQNFGAGKLERVKKGYFTAAGIVAIWGMITTCVLFFGAEPVFSLFIHEKEILPMGINYMKILGIGQMFMCIELMTVGALSGLSKTLICSVVSITLTSSRIPMAILLGNTALGLNGVWWAYTISTIAKGIIFFIVFQWVISKLHELSKSE